MSMAFLTKLQEMQRKLEEQGRAIEELRRILGERKKPVLTLPKK